MTVVVTVSQTVAVSVTVAVSQTVTVVTTVTVAVGFQVLVQVAVTVMVSQTVRGMVKGDIMEKTLDQRIDEIDYRCKKIAILKTNLFLIEEMIKWDEKQCEMALFNDYSNGLIDYKVCQERMLEEIKKEDQ